MQFLMTPKSTTLSSLADRIGERNVEDMLNVNSLSRSVNIGKAFYSRSSSAVGEIDPQTKINILNTLVGDSDIYERAALGSEADWWNLSNYGCFADALKVPETLLLPPATDVLGNGESISTDIYNLCVNSLASTGLINPTIFSESIIAGDPIYGIISDDNGSRQGNLLGQAFNSTSQTRISPYQNFDIPWGKITLYSSFDGRSMDIPAYPEEGISWGSKANYTQMPDILYQYEPWQVYQSSGPRQITFTFHLHRDMWTGDHTDGNAAKLVRFCEANCYPNYNGASVVTPTVSMYINGSNIITGIMTDTQTNWKGPIGSDGFYLEFNLSLTIVEVSPSALNYNTVLKKGLIE